jgi:DNA invertase Pin-like site-specific DNA recombinase
MYSREGFWDNDLVKVGYIRTSKKDQNPQLQRKDLLAAGCEKIFEEQISSRKAERPQLRAALEYVRKGDALVVWKLDRFGRSLQELIELVRGLKERGIEFVSLRESIDTTTPGGKLVFHVFGAVAEFERDLVLERTVAGLEAARARGRRGGRPRALDESKARLARRLKAEGEHSVEEICSMLGVGRSTLYRYLAEEDEADSKKNEGSKLRRPPQPDSMVPGKRS